MINYILAYLIVVPCFYWFGKEMRYAQEVAFNMASIGLFFVSFFFNRSSVRTNKTSRFLSMFCLWTLFLFCYGQITWGYNYLINTLCIMIVYSLVITTLRKEDTVKIFKVIIGVCAFNTVYALCQYANFDIVGFYMQNLPQQAPEPCGLFGLPAHLGIYSGIAMVCIAYFNPFIALVCVVPLYLSKSSGAILGSACGYLYVLWFQRRTMVVRLKNFRLPIIYLVTIPVLLFGVLYGKYIDYPMGMFKTRPDAWRVMINESLYNPVLGHGLDSMRQGDVKFLKDPTTEKTVRAKKIDTNRYDIYGTDVVRNKLNPQGIKWDLWDNCHNGYIQVIYEHSLIGLTLALLIIFSIFKRVIVQTREVSCLLGIIIVFLVSSLTQFPFYVARLAHLFPVILGLFILHTENT